jgi:hypothetical protein
MSNLILGSNSKFGKILKDKLPGVYLNKQQFDLLQPDFSCVKIESVDNLIILARGGAQNFAQAGTIADTVSKLISTVKYNTAWVFTSGLGTYAGSKNNSYIPYSVEKMLLTFVSYKKNFDGHNIKIINPGHMDSDQSYSIAVDKFLLLLDNPPDKNLIWSLSKNSYVPF